MGRSPLEGKGHSESPTVGRRERAPGVITSSVGFYLLPFVVPSLYLSQSWFCPDLHLTLTPARLDIKHYSVLLPHICQSNVPRPAFTFLSALRLNMQFHLSLVAQHDAVVYIDPAFTHSSPRLVSVALLTSSRIVTPHVSFSRR